MSKVKYYVVWKGRKPGIYNNFDEAEKQVKGFPNNKWKGFDTEKEAQTAFSQVPKKPTPIKKIEYKGKKYKKSFEEPLATDKQMAFIESLRSQLGEMVYEHAIKKLKFTEDDYTVYEASEMIEYLLEVRDTPKMKVEIQTKTPIKENTIDTNITEMQILLDRVVTELQIYRMRNPK